MRPIYLSIICTFCSTIVHSKLPPPLYKSTARAFGTISNNTRPLAFIENKGQITDQYRGTRSDIQFKVSAAPYLSIFIGSGVVHYQFNRAENAKENAERRFLDFSADSTETAYTMYRMDVELVGANKNARVKSDEKQDYYENYFTQGIGGYGTVAYTYRRITYKEIYPNIDWILYMSNGQMKYEFVVRNGGKVSDIRIKYSGASDIRLNVDGSLTVWTPLGSITEDVPISYEQNGMSVKSCFKLIGDELTYEAGAHSGTLIIDPTVGWSTYFGGSNIEEANCVTTDRSGNVLLSGFTKSISGIATIGAYQMTYGGNDPSAIAFGDAFLAKFNSSGAILWATYFGGNREERAYGTAIDTSGNIYMVGATNSLSSIATPGAYQVTNDSAGSAFLVKLNSTGAVEWSTFFGGASADYGYAVALTNSGDVFITGKTNSTFGIATTTAHQTVYSGNTDAFVAKFNSTGALLWCTYYGGNANDVAYSIAVDRDGSAYITGNTFSSTGIATTGAYTDTFTGGALVGDAFLAKFNGSGTLLWATYYGGDDDELGYGVAADSAGNVYITGYTKSISGIATTGAYQEVQGDGGIMLDAFLAKFNGSGSILWGTYFGGSGRDVGCGIAIDNKGYVYITGFTSSTQYIATPGAYQPTLGSAGTNGNDAYLAKFTSTGVIQMGTYYGGDNNDEGFAVTADDGGNVYVAGETSSISAIATTTAYQHAYAGGAEDVFLVKFSRSIDEVTNLSASEDEVVIYPNPAQNSVGVSTAHVHTIVVYNCLGQIVVCNSYNGENNVRVNIGQLPAGIYTMTVNNSKASMIVKE